MTENTDFGLDLTQDPNFAFGTVAATTGPGGTPPKGVHVDPASGLLYDSAGNQLSGYYGDPALGTETYNGLPQGVTSLRPGDPGYVPPGTPQNQVPGYYQADAQGNFLAGDYNAYTRYALSRGVTPALAPGATPSTGTINVQPLNPHLGSYAGTPGGLRHLGTTPAAPSGTAPTSSGSGSGGSAGGGSSSGGGGGSAGSGGTQAQQDALATIRNTLGTYGLGSLADWAWSEIVGGKSQDQVLLDLMQRPEFTQRFPAIQARQKAGLPPISPADYVNYENQATQLMREAGLPSGFWDSPSDFTHLLSSDVSINELQQRLNLATQAAFGVPTDVRATLARDYGVGAGQLAAFFLDDKTALPLIQRDFTAAQIGGAASRTGYGSTKTEDEHLADLGVNAGQAQSGFNQLAMQRQLFSSLPGENTTGISRDEQLGATFDANAAAQQKIVRRSQERQAQFAGGGSFAGIGTAQGA